MYLKYRIKHKEKQGETIFVSQALSSLCNQLVLHCIEKQARNLEPLEKEDSSCILCDGQLS